MKILHVITDLNTGGAEKLMVDLLPRLVYSNIDIELCVFNGIVTPFYNELNNTGIKIHQLGNKADYYNPKHIVRLIKLARKFDIVHTHNTAPQLFGAIGSLFCKNRWITTEHTTTSHRRVWWYRPIERWMYHRYETVICISEATAKSVISFLGNNGPNISIIPNGINYNLYKNAVPIAKDSIGIKTEDKKVLLMVGRYSYQKDQATIIKALTKLPSNVELWLAGYGETETELRKLAETLSLTYRVQFLGMRTDVPNLLKASDIVIQSSHIEGFGLAAIEAMAAGKPVIATNIPGLREVVNNAGLLFDHEDFNQLSILVKDLLDNPIKYSQKVSQGYKCAIKYSIDQMSDKYLSIYNI